MKHAFLCALAVTVLTLPVLAQKVERTVSAKAAVELVTIDTTSRMITIGKTCDSPSRSRGERSE
jgi:hypothetical protein